MRKTPTVWYRNSVYMMGDMEMVYLQKRDCASCAVWEWIKSDCWKRTSPAMKELSKIEKEGVVDSLGIYKEDGTADTERFDAIVERIRNDVGWIDERGEIKGWDKWQSVNTKIEDAARKRVDYWEKRNDEYEDLTVPPELDTPEFKIAWEEYEKYRRLSGFKKLKSMSVSRMWKEMAEWGGETVAISAIETTIAKGWQGIFPPRSTGGAASATGSNQPYEKRLWALEHHKKTLTDELAQLREWHPNDKTEEKKALAKKIKEIREMIKNLDPTKP